jgi:hypothetical protein
MTRRELRAKIEMVLGGECANRCMDDETDRQATVLALCRVLYERRCQSCDHEEDVHQGEHCLGGPETHCDCQGYEEEP